jgi:hypothetical protein
LLLLLLLLLLRHRAGHGLQDLHQALGHAAQVAVPARAPAAAAGRPYAAGGAAVRGGVMLRAAVVPTKSWRGSGGSKPSHWVRGQRVGKRLLLARRDRRLRGSLRRQHLSRLREPPLPGSALPGLGACMSGHILSHACWRQPALHEATRLKRLPPSHQPPTRRSLGTLPHLSAAHRWLYCCAARIGHLKAGSRPITEQQAWHAFSTARVSRATLHQQTDDRG